ncbi:para-nitrobenzyl esterase [Algoriphagus ratkowskyi]|uniref:Carboxylic ester hydrolase n=1 Tax=Algoriphagus ratkowskyi TaxID=57028 RepID=A0A2W7QW47_9BACT|nr:carboxylesterase family protein [Algoriphagus ratkowskyi]PZX52748.1 para-nitrobenzyl esterase [Algoriphagus ratkowskyi]TXD76304.1 carboxylesterase family protein [Algoriphagus ratkowskyi]
MKPTLRSFRILTLALLVGIVSTAFSQTINSLEVHTKINNGMISGSYDTKTGIQKFFGIPFAKPPVGELRWKAPQSLDNWSGIKETKRFGPRAIQAPVFGDMDFKSDGISEDCLYLNVWTPADRNTKDLPVLVYFYGGGFVAGDGSEPRYNGEAMAQKGIVVVTVNYRLAVFGFLAHPDLSAESPYKASGNYGLMDQLASLQWVKENISAFGGDPKKVTIAGESAGSISVSYQMASPLAKGLIAGAIGESGAGINPTLAPTPLAEAEKIGVDFATKAGFKSIKELRALSTKDVYDIYNESKRFGFPVVLDGYFLPKTLPEIFEAKEQAMVPLLAGWNSAEIPGAAFMQGQPYTSEAFIAKVKETYPKDYEEVLSLHPHADAKEVERSATDLAADRFIVYSTWKWLDLHAKNSDQPVYRYLYSKLRPPMKDASLTAGLAGGTIKDGPKAPEAIGAPHACEIEYAMGNLPLVDVFAWTADDYKVSKTFMNYFANFIKTGNPNGDEQPEWNAMKGTDSAPPVMVIDTESKLVKATDDVRYHFHDRSYGNIK